MRWSQASPADGFAVVEGGSEGGQGRRLNLAGVLVEGFLDGRAVSAVEGRPPRVDGRLVVESRDGAPRGGDLDGFDARKDVFAGLGGGSPDDDASGVEEGRGRVAEAEGEGGGRDFGEGGEDVGEGGGVEGAKQRGGHVVGEGLAEQVAGAAAGVGGAVASQFSVVGVDLAVGVAREGVGFFEDRLRCVEDHFAGRGKRAVKAALRRKVCLLHRWFVLTGCAGGALRDEISGV